MFETKRIVNFIYKEIKEREEIVTHIQSIALWHKPIVSAISLLILEIIFAIFYFIKARQITVILSIIATFALLNIARNNFPAFFNKIFSFQIPQQEENASNRIRSPSELSAYFTTLLSFFFDVVGFIFLDPEATSIIRLSISGFLLLVSTVFCYLLGDFWIIYIVFHILFVIPGILLHPKVYTILFSNEEEPDGNSAQVPPNQIFPPSGGIKTPQTIDMSEHVDTIDTTLSEAPEKNRR